MVARIVYGFLGVVAFGIGALIVRPAQASSRAVLQQQQARHAGITAITAPTSRPQPTLTPTKHPATDYPAWRNYAVTRSSHYFAFMTGGPCAGLSSCTLQSYAKRPGFIEMIYAGRKWVWDAGKEVYTSKAVMLSSLTKYTHPTWVTGGSIAGPCAGYTSSQKCPIYYRFFYVNAYGKLREVVMTSSKAYYYDFSSSKLLLIDSSIYVLGTSDPQPGGGKPRP